MKLLPKFLILVIIFAFILTTALSIMVYMFTKSSLEKAIAQQQLILADQSIEKVDRFLYEKINNILAISEDEEFEGLLSGKDINNQEEIKESSNKLRELTLYTGPWDSLTLVNLDGNIVFSTGNRKSGASILDQNLQKNVFQNILNGDTYYSDVFQEEELGKPSMIFAAPIRNEDDEKKKVVGAVVGHIAWRSVLEVLPIVEGKDVELINKNGIEIGDNHPENFDEIFEEEFGDNAAALKAISGKRGTEVGVTTEEEKGNIQVLTSYTSEPGYLSYRGNNWSLLVESPTSLVFAEARNNALFLSVLLFPIILLSVGVMIGFFYKFINSPLTSLTQSIQGFARGNFQSRAKIASHDEIGVLAATFNNMATQLQSLTVGLEQKVQEKTAELQKEKESIEQKVVERTRQLSYEQDRLQASINSLSVGYVMTGPDNKVILINTAAIDIFTLSTASAHPVQKANDVTELRGMIDIDYIHNALRDRVDVLEQMEEAKKRKSNMLLKDIPYKMLMLNLFIAPIVSKDTNATIGIVMLIEDITERKVSERSRDEFFSIASHELRTPLTAIRGNASMIMDYFMDEIKNPEVKSIIADIHESSLRLIDIVGDFLDMSRLEQGKIKYESEPFEIVKLCEEVFKEYDVTGSRKKLYFKIDQPASALPLVYADKSRVRQVLVNLVGNGLKFTEQGGISMAFQLNEHQVKVFVTDTGQGISEDSQNLLFRKFQQAESNILTRDNTKGTGLGLYISRLMMKDMGGEVSLEKSAVGQGSTFSITIPTATQAQTDEYQKSHQAKQVIVQNGSQQV